MELFLLIFGGLVVLPFGVYYARRHTIFRTLSESELNYLEKRSRQVQSSLTTTLVKIRLQACQKVAAELAIRELGNYGASGARFSALENAGIRSVHQLPNLEHLERISGVGPHTAGLLRNAASRIVHEYPLTWSDIEASANAESVRELVSRLSRVSTLTHDIQILAEPFRRQRGSILTKARGLGHSGEELKVLADEAAKIKANLLKELDQITARLNQLKRSQRDLAEPAEVLRLFNRKALQSDTPHSAMETIPSREGTEKHFEDQSVVPWLERNQIDYERQYPINKKIGSARHRVFADFVLRDRYGQIITLIESKRQIVTPTELDEAIAQAKSYALELKVRRFMLASPEGLWVVSWTVEEHEILRVVPPKEIDASTEEIRELIGF